ncbi:MAG: hypothetical protein HFJ31_02300 [Clostridia bacterium]|nr:hypothetical protein [Clostridia bacterium]
MFKMMDRLYNHWERMRRKSDWFVLAQIGEVFALVGGPLYIFYIVAPYLKNIPCFSDYSRSDIALNIWGVLACMFVIFMMAWIFHGEWEERKAQQRLKKRELSDYVEKYQKYVDVVKHALQADEYKEVELSEDWVQRFDNYLDMSARLRVRREQDFTDFEVMACLMYALTYKLAGAINVQFAFHCAKEFLHTHNVYQCERIEGDELILEPSESLKEVSFENVEASTLIEGQAIMGVYLSQRESYSQILELADFLRIFYLRCDK